MDWVETTGRTVEEAKEAALDVLGVDASEAVFEVLEEPKSGFLGLSKKAARVRARVRPTTPRAKDGRRETRRRQKGSDGAAKPDSELAGAGEQLVEDGDAGTSARSAAVTGRSHQKSKARVRPQEPGDRARRSKGTVVEKGSEGQALSVVSEGPSRIELAGLAQHFLAGILGEMGLAGSVHVDSVDDESIELSILGDDLGVLIGPRGHVVSAIQELTRAIVQRSSEDSAGRVTVDVAGYRAKRVKALERFTTQLAQEVLESGEEKALEPMVSADRKIVHDTAAEIAGVGTRSEGYDPRRYVVIFRSDESPAESD